MQSNFEESVLECDALLICDCFLNNMVKHEILEKVKFAIKEGKELFCLQEDRAFYEIIKKGCPKQLWGEKKLKVDIPFCSKKGINSQLGNIPVPVIVITGWTENVDKFQVQLQLRKNLQEMG